MTVSITEPDLDVTPDAIARLQLEAKDFRSLLYALARLWRSEGSTFDSTVLQLLLTKHTDLDIEKVNALVETVNQRLGSSGTAAFKRLQKKYDDLCDDMSALGDELDDAYDLQSRVDDLQAEVDKLKTELTKATATKPN